MLLTNNVFIAPMKKRDNGRLKGVPIRLNFNIIRCLNSFVKCKREREKVRRRNINEFSFDDDGQMRNTDMIYTLELFNGRWLFLFFSIDICCIQATNSQISMSNRMEEMKTFLNESFCVHRKNANKSYNHYHHHSV